MAELAHLIIAVATLVTAIGSVVVSMLNRRTISAVAKQTDGMLSTMKSSARKEGKAEAVAEGKAKP